MGSQKRSEGGPTVEYPGGLRCQRGLKNGREKSETRRIHGRGAGKGKKSSGKPGRGTRHKNGRKIQSQRRVDAEETQTGRGDQGSKRAVVRRKGAFPLAAKKRGKEKKKGVTEPKGVALRYAIRFSGRVVGETYGKTDG